MGTCLPPTSMHHHHHLYCGVLPNSIPASPSHFVSVACSAGSFIHFSFKFNRIHSSVFRSHCVFSPFLPNPKAWSGRCQASSPGPPPPPKLESPSGESRASSSGALLTLTRVQDAVRIFFAVFFWMSLFFWSCVWDGRNNGPREKGSRFRR